MPSGEMYGPPKYLWWGPNHLDRSLDPSISPEALERLADPSRNRVWIMPDRSKYQSVELESVETFIDGEDDMAAKKKNAKAPKAKLAEKPTVDCASPDLPVEVNGKTPEGKPLEEKFDNLASFLDWFDGTRYKVAGSIADPSITMISVDPIPQKVVPKAELDPGDPTMTAVAGGRGAVVKKGGKERVPQGTHKEGKESGVGVVKRHWVKVNGKGPYSSAWAAWQDLGMGDASSCAKFRGELKKTANGKLDFKLKDKVFSFELVPPGAGKAVK